MGERASLVVTVKVFFVVLEGEGPVVLAQPDDGGDVLGVLVGEALHQNLLVGPPGADLHPLQVEQLLEDAPLDLVPKERGCSTSTFITQGNFKVASVVA